MPAPQDLHFKAEFPTDCIRGVIAKVRAGNLVGVETIDHAAQAIGNLNAFRADGIFPIGNTVDEPGPSAATLRAEDPDELCDRIEAMLPDDDAEVRAVGFTIPRFLLPVLTALFQKLLERLVAEEAA